MGEMPRPLPIRALLIYLRKKYIKELYETECMWLQATGMVADKDKFKRYFDIDKDKKQGKSSESKTGEEIIDDLINKMKKA